MSGPQPLLPDIPNQPGAYAQRFGQFFGPQTILSNLTVGNGASINLIPAAGTPPGFVPANIGQPGVQTYTQAGRTSIAFTPFGTLTFPVAFPTACDSCVVMTPYGGNGTAYHVQMNGTPSASSAPLVLLNGSAGQTATVTCEWVATGH